SKCQKIVTKKISGGLWDLVSVCLSDLESTSCVEGKRTDIWRDTVSSFSVYESTSPSTGRKHDCSTAPWINRTSFTFSLWSVMCQLSAWQRLQDLFEPFGHENVEEGVHQRAEVEQQVRHQPQVRHRLREEQRVQEDAEDEGDVE
ncbi:hypothetical protein FQN60_014670, partial [Etheostoma spectabile]